MPRPKPPRLLTRAALLLAAIALATAVRAAELTVVLTAGSQPTAASVRLNDAAGQPVIPADALELAGLGYHYAPGELIHYADWTSTRLRSQDPFFGSSFFRASRPPGQAGFVAHGRFHVTVPPGRYTLVVTKGLEFLPVSRTLDLSGDHSESVNLERWVRLADQGWYSGDGHAHLARTDVEADRVALLWAEATDVHAVNVLRMGDARETYYPQHAAGPTRSVQAGERALLPGQEDPRTRGLGHTLHLGLAAPVRQAGTYYDYAPVFAAVRAAGGLTGFAHVGRRRWSFAVDRGLSLAAPAGLVDFVEVAQMGYIGVNLWYEFLNLGFPLTAMAGNDVPWGGTLGSTRVYAHLAGPFSPAAWLEAVRRGHTFVTTGPALELTVNGHLPGSRLAVPRGTLLRIRAKAWAGTADQRPTTLRLVSLGRTLAAGPGPTLELDLPADHSRWITAEAETGQQPRLDLPGFFAGAVATPVYVTVDGQPWRDPASLPAQVAARLASLDAIEAWLASQEPNEGARGGWESADARAASAPAIRAAVAQARAWYQALRPSAP
jgi:hypothetical protein